jgi:FHA domain
MADTRLNSAHLEFLTRRQEYRRTREDLLGARGWLTEAVEHVHGMLGEGDDWLALSRGRPDQILLATRFLLVEQQTGRSYPLKIGLNTIGRLRNNDIVLEERPISRRHCVLLVHAGGGCELHDTASRNGTFVNGHLIRQPVQLVSGDRIQVSERLLLFVSEED